MAAAPKLNLVNAISHNTFVLAKPNAVVALGDKIVVGDVYRDGDTVVLLVASTLVPATLESILAS